MRIPIAVSSAAMLLAACSSSKGSEKASGPTPVEVQATGTPGQAIATTTQKMTAKVLAVDTAARRITLQAEDGHSETVNVPPGVHRLEEIVVGDTVVAEVSEGVMFEYQPPGSAFVAPAAVVAGGRADQSQAPAIGAAAGVQSTVTITAINLDSRVVEFQDPDGFKYHVKAGKGLAIEKLVVGDRLLATYVATVAIGIERKAP